MTKSDYIVSIQKVTKVYNSKFSLFSELIKKKSPKLRSFDSGFAPLSEVSFKVRKGQSVGLLGLNGAGKSTLLQILAKTLRQTSGDIEVNGKVIALLELGAGFNIDFTGRENLYLYASLLGYKKKEMPELIDEVITFSELGEKVDFPLRTYSSGMVMRLAFSIAVHSSADLIIVDESLAVGDFLFQQKCYRKITQLLENGLSLILVSHSPNLILEYCDQVLVLEKGKNIFWGSAKEGIEFFQKRCLENKIKFENTGDKLPKKATSFDINCVELINTKAFKSNGDLSNTFTFSESIFLEFSILFKKPLIDVHCGFQIKDQNGKIIFGINTNSLHKIGENFKVNDAASYVFQIRDQKLNTGKYSVSLGVASEVEKNFTGTTFKSPLIYLHDVLTFSIIKKKPDDNLWSGDIFLETSCQITKLT
ncbi:MAG: ABC transporter ATP-binding protein [Verrucomicrobia bacterium]|nr:ABC transporter ATP-binding protein [Verrucomicrobiota bacterium]